MHKTQILARTFLTGIRDGMKVGLKLPKVARDLYTTFSRRIHHKVLQGASEASGRRGVSLSLRIVEEGAVSTLSRI
jgi:hypothetical protein